MDGRDRKITVIDGVEYLSPNEATAALIEGGASPVGAYQRLMKLAQFGLVKTFDLGTRARLYHRADVLAAGDGSLRDREHGDLKPSSAKSRRKKRDQS